MAQSPADREAQEIEDVERIARALYEAEREAMAEMLRGTTHTPLPSWDTLDGGTRDQVRGIVRSLLAQEVIAVGRRPAPPSVIPGQINIHGDEAA